MGKKVRQRAIALLIAVLTVGQSFTLTGFAQSSDGQSSTSSNVSSENTKAFSIDLTGDAQYSEGIESEPLNVVNADGVNPDAAKLTKGYSINSEKFDLRNVNGKSYTTPVRSQAPFGTCWSFATIAAIESSILGAGLNGADGKTADPKTLNLSEKQIAWFSARPINIPGHPQYGEGQYIEESLDTPEGLTSFMNRGGNYLYSAIALMQGIGPCHESSDPQYEYHGDEATVDYRWMDGKMQKYSYSDKDTWSISDDLRFRSDYSIKETHDLPCTGFIDENGYYTYNEEGTKAIKQELLNLRGVQVSFSADTSMPDEDGKMEYISENWAHYTYMPNDINHAVTVIGWDDNYPKENFIKGSITAIMGDGKIVEFDKQPPANGAWLVKNSWGSGENEFPDREGADWGIVENGVHTGYFWISYYDKSLARQPSISYVVEQADENVNNIDQHDFMPIADPVSGEFDEEVKMANKFVAQHNELIKQAGCYTTFPNTEVTYEIYLLDYVSQYPTDGIKVAERKVKYKYNGMHKESIKDFNILFDTLGDGSGRIAVAKKQNYAIVVTQKNEDGNYLINYQYAFNEGTGMGSYKGVINKGESYTFCDGEWKDYTDSDGLKKELDKMIGYEPEDNWSFDNFPIKSYTQTLDNDTEFELLGSNIVYYKTENNNSATLHFDIHTEPGYDPDFTQDDVKWCLMPFPNEKGKVYVDGEPVSGDPTRYKFISKDTAAKRTRAGVTIKGIGTISIRILCLKMSFDDIVFPPTGRGPKRSYAYTGKEIKPCVGVSGSRCVEELVEGKDYEFIYSNNIKCGIASVTAKPKGERIASDCEATAEFAIVPAKPVIKNIEADGTRLIVSIKDQSESDPSGYIINYRVKGEKDWQGMVYNGAGDTFTLFGTEPGKKYEVTVTGFTRIPKDSKLWNESGAIAGETSEIKTVDTPSKIDPIVRIFGDNRFATAAEIAKNTYEKADTVVLAYGMNYADALAGVTIASAMNAPILLTNTDSLPRQTTNAIEKLGAKNVIILGGTGVISETVENTLKQQKLNTERIAGSTRFETAVKIAEKIGSLTRKAPKELFFVYANNFADALSASSVAAAKGSCVLYLRTDGELDKATAKYLESVKGSVENAYVIGGEGVISDEMMKAAGDALGIEPTRISGNNRYETCIAVNEAFNDVLTGNCLCVATGADFPDALAGGVYAALYYSPMMLAAGSLSKQQTDYLKSREDQQIVVFGGKGAVSDELVDKIVKAKAKG